MVLGIFGCAHKIVISPDIKKISRDAGTASRINANVGFFIPAEAMGLEVTTPGGGGDNVRYFPYRDIEVAYQIMLSNVFENAIKLRSAFDADELKMNQISFVFTPEVITNSGSTGFFTWPPTNFTVDLTSKIRESSGRMNGTPRSIGNGHVDGLMEFNGDFGLAGRRAMTDALLKMQRSLIETNFEKNSVNKFASSVDEKAENFQKSGSDARSRLEGLKKLFDADLINKEEYEYKKMEIIEDI